MSDVHDESVPAARNLPDLDVVQAKIDEARAAEDHLVQVDPGAIDPGAVDPDDAPAGTVPPAEGYVEEPDPAAHMNAETDTHTDTHTDTPAQDTGDTEGTTRS